MKKAIQLKFLPAIVVSITVAALGYNALHNSRATTNNPDFNGDTKVDIFDLSILAGNWGKDNQSQAQGDANGDHTVNIFDLSILAGIWGQTIAYSFQTIPDTNYDPAGGIFVDATNGNDNNNGSQASPYKTLTKAITAATTGAKIVLRTGTYREGTLNSDGTTNNTLRGVSKRLTIQAYPHEQAWLDGSVIVTGWAQSGSTWSVASSPSRFLCKPSTDACVVDPSQIDGTNGPMAASPQMVFRNGTQLTEVANLAAVGAGKFYFDQSTNQLTIGDNPSGATIEVTTQRRALNFAAGASSSQLLGIGVRRYGSILNSSSVNSDFAFAMVTAAAATGMKIENSLFTQSASRGLDLVAGSNNSIVQNNIFTPNGANGVDSDSLSGLTFTNNQVTDNNAENFSYADNAAAVIAGSKMTRLTSSTISNNSFSDNKGSGFWCDLDCDSVNIVNNIVSGNSKNGIYYEVSTNGMIASNTVFKNDAYGIKNSSDNTRIYNNTVARNHQAMLIYHDTRHAISNVNVVNNIFANNDGSTAALFDTQQSSTKGASDFFTTLDYNAYQRDSAGTPTKLVEWCQAGSSCSTSYATFSAFKSATSKETHGIGVDQSNPFFTNEATDNYMLRSGTSPVGAGIALPSDIATAIGAPTGAVSMGALPWQTVSSITLTPTEDSHVLNGFNTAGTVDSSNTNFNYVNFLRADVGERASCGLPTNNTTPCNGHHDRLIYMKFNLANLAFTPSSAKLRLYVTAGDYCSFGNYQQHYVHQTSNNTWTEGNITWNNKPSYDTTSLGNGAPLAENTYFEIPLTNLSFIHTGNMSLVVENTWLCHRTFDSSETSHPPQLVINP